MAAAARFGMLRPPPGPGNGFCLPCWECDGRDDACGTCGGRGHLLIERPLDQELADEGESILEFLFLFDAIEQGTWPAAGGLWDQPVNLTQAVRFFRARVAEWKAKLNAPAEDEP